jgi:Patatin-like phospholipase
MRALNIFAGPAALAHLRQHGLSAQHVRVMPAAAGGPKGLILGPLDKFIFGQWLASSAQQVHLVGASIGAWRMATACLHDPVAAFQRLENDYIRQEYDIPPGRNMPSAQEVSDKFGQSLQQFYGGRVHEVLQHTRFKLHVVTSRGRHMLRREHKLVTPLGYAGAFVTNALHRKAMGAWLERVVFSNAASDAPSAACAPLPFATTDYRTRQVHLTQDNFMPALQASCSIPFALKAVHDIPGAPRGAYWDGGITDYHLHLNYQMTGLVQGTAQEQGEPSDGGIVLYPHFQQAVVPGWLDKALKWRHSSSAFLNRMVLLAPKPEWIATLPRAKLPDRQDFAHHGRDLAARVAQWTTCTSAAQQLADEFTQWLERPDTSLVRAL